MPIYMNYDGIEGESSATGHEKWIELQSFSWGEGRGLIGGQGGSTRESGTVNISDVNIVKMADCASPKLFVAGATGTLDKVVKIDFVRTAKGEEQVYMQYTLTGTGVSSYSISGNGSDRPTESLSLNFDKIEYKYNAIGDDLTGNPEIVSYDLATKKSSGG
jgi:type VI secretion system secreted protein Hcp